MLDCAFRIIYKDGISTKKEIDMHKKNSYFFESKEEAQKYMEGFNMPNTGRPDRDTYVTGPFDHDSGHQVGDPKRQVGFAVEVEIYK
jgi:hypothetical protein|tara:strand:- start:1159 stop:1419 length:261 start_codon:yes stop_codon:yes gene_type:complete